VSTVASAVLLAVAVAATRARFGERVLEDGTSPGGVASPQGRAPLGDQLLDQRRHQPIIPSGFLIGRMWGQGVLGWLSQRAARRGSAGQWARTRPASRRSSPLWLIAFAVTLWRRRLAYGTEGSEISGSAGLRVRRTGAGTSPPCARWLPDGASARTAERALELRRVRDKRSLELVERLVELA
jgi:hypothetical protein